MGLATIDIIFEGMSAGCATSLNHSVSEAIIGLDSLLTHAATALYGSIVDPEVDIRRTDEPGRYEVDLGFRSNIGMARRAELSAVPMFTDPDPQVVIQALGFTPEDLVSETEPDLAPGSVEGVLPLILALAGRGVTQVFYMGDSVDVRAGTRGLFHVSRASYQLFSSIEVRRGFAALGKALADPAVTGIRIVDRASGAQVCSLSAAEIEHLRMPQARNVKLTDTVVTVALQLAGPVFRTDEGWIFTDGRQEVRAQMCDEEFLRVVDNGIFPIEPGMILIVNMRVQSSQVAGKLMSDCSIIKVLDLRDSRSHLPMPGIA